MGQRCICDEEDITVYLVGDINGGDDRKTSTTLRFNTPDHNDWSDVTCTLLNSGNATLTTHTAKLYEMRDRIVCRSVLHIYI